MARPNPNKFPNYLSPRIDKDGDILVSSASSTSSGFDPEFDSTELSEQGEKSPQVYPKSQGTISTSNSTTATEKSHTKPAVRAAREKKKVQSPPGSTASPHSLYQSVPLPVDSMLRSAIREAKPLLVTIFGSKIIDPLIAISDLLPENLAISHGEAVIKMAVRRAAAKIDRISHSAFAALKEASLLVQDRDQWEQVIREARETLKPEEYPATVLGNAVINCKTVFRLLQML